MTHPYIHFGGRLFRAVETSGNGQVNAETIFKYDQRDSLITATYSGGEIEFGHLIGIMYDDGTLDFSYHHVTLSDEICTGKGTSDVELLAGNKVRLRETWQWTSGDKSSGTSILEEI